jgi:ferritin-like protein
MTYHARIVLEDCRYTLRLLEEEADHQKWRITWVAAIALIRAVGHVLDKVDGRDKQTKDVAGKLYKNWHKEPEKHEIFHEFIEKERNNVVKEYSVNILSS